MLKQIQKFFKNLKGPRDECMVPIPDSINPFQNHSTLLTISSLNIRSLRKHSIDVKFDLQIFNSDVVGFTETQFYHVISPCHEEVP